MGIVKVGPLNDLVVNVEPLNDLAKDALMKKIGENKHLFDLVRKKIKEQKRELKISIKEELKKIMNEAIIRALFEEEVQNIVNEIFDGELQEIQESICGELSSSHFSFVVKSHYK